MWIILLFVYLTAALPNNAQKFTSFEAQTATETYANSDVNKDSTRPPVTLTIQSGRTENADRIITQNTDLPLFYSNQWQPILMPIGFNSDRDTEKYVNENERPLNPQIVPTFLRRPDEEANNTVPNQFSLIEERNQVATIPFSYIPYFYHENNFNLSSDTLTNNGDEIYADVLPNESTPRNVGNFQTFGLFRNTENIAPSVNLFQSTSQSSLNVQNTESSTERKQIPSTPAGLELRNNEATRISEESIKPLSTENNNIGKEILNAENFYRNSQRYFPPLIPAYFQPYQFMPFQRGDVFQPVISYPSSNPNFDRESGSEVNERIQVPEKNDVSINTSDPAIETVSSEPSASIVPPQSLPSPVAGYPFGLYPPPFVNPLIPNIPPSGFPMRPIPLPFPRSLQRGNEIPDAPLFPPVLPIKPPTDVIPDVLPQTDSLLPAEQASIITGTEINSQEIVPLEESDSLKIPYEFGFDMTDGKGNDQHRKEVSDISGVVTGSYGYKNEKGIFRMVFYKADKNGFHASIQSNEPGVASSGSADATFFAEKPPPRLILEGRNENVPIITAASDPNVDIIAAGSISETK